MSSRLPLRLGALSDPGLERPHNEDTWFADPALGIFAVIDGVGGQNAGEKAAEIASQELRARLTRPDGTVEQALREGITIANNKIYQTAQLQPQLTGMACVLSAAVIDEGRLVVGHVGDSRVYKVKNGRLEKLTHDHSPIGEREDRGELNELEAMRHPRRNEVYRDVGSELHDPEDEDFIEIVSLPFEPDEALLLCSDGLSDLVTSERILEAIQRGAGKPQQTCAALIQMALSEGGKDNVTVLVVEGPAYGGKVSGGDAARLGEGSSALEGDSAGPEELPTRRLGVISGEAAASIRSSSQRTNPRITPAERSLAGEITGRSAPVGGHDDSPARPLTLIKSPERRTGGLRSVRESGASEVTSESWGRGVRRTRDDEPVEFDPRRSRGDQERVDGRRGEGRGDPSRRTGGDNGSADGTGARVIPLPTLSPTIPEEPPARGGRNTPKTSKIPAPWLARLPGWALPLTIMGLVLVLLLSYLWWSRPLIAPPGTPPETTTSTLNTRTIERVNSIQSLREKLANARPGTLLIVGEGEYNENIALQSGVTVVAASPGRVILSPLDGDRPAVIAEGVANAALIGFVIGKPDAPRKLGVSLVDSDVLLADVQIVGTTEVGLKLKGTTLALQYNVVVSPASGVGEAADLTAKSVKLSGMPASAVPDPAGAVTPAVLPSVVPGAAPGKGGGAR